MWQTSFIICWRRSCFWLCFMLRTFSIPLSDSENLQHQQNDSSQRTHTLVFIHHQACHNDRWKGRKMQCCGLRPWSYDKTGLRPVPVLVLVLQFRSWSWSCRSGLGLGLNILVLFPIVQLMRIKITIKHGVDPRAHVLYLKLTKCYPRARWL